MGHTLGTDREYQLLQQRLDTSLTGAPDSPTFLKILKILFRPDDADLALKLPLSLKPLSAVARETGMDPAELDARVTEMARRGLVLDLELGGRRFVILAPVVIGFFEFTYMRTRDDLPMKELSELFEHYMRHDGLAQTAFAGTTQLGRALVREEALAAGDFTEVLDWERLSAIVRDATDISVALCACRHHQSHLGTACDRPLRTCLTLNHGVQPMEKAGLSERITADEALRILALCKEQGLVQVVDNVKRRPTFLCNCCGCCCGMLQAIKTCNQKGAVVTSNWEATVDATTCDGCGKCVKACPLGALSLVKELRGGKKRARAVVDGSLCLGCGVCKLACTKTGALTMTGRPQRVYTPESAFDKAVAMAIERGKLGGLLAESTPDLWGPQAFARIVGALERTAPFKAAMAIKPLKSAFLNGLVAAAKASAGRAGKSVL